MFHAPAFLLLLPLLGFLAWRMFSPRRIRGIGFSSAGFAGELPKTIRQRMVWLPNVLILLSLVFLIVSLARPREGREQTITASEGIAIELIVDRSGSMQALDFKIDGQRVNRLTAIKNVAAKFVMGDDQLDGRFSDLVGLVTFAGYADGVTPPTLDHAFLTSSLNSTSIVSQRSEDGTAIGDAIALGVEKLTALDDERDEKVKSKIMILLTDGENTAGELQPAEAAELAKTLGIKIYTIGVGTQGQAPIPVRNPFSGRQQISMMRVTIDEATLKEVAKLTGGQYFRATDTDSLTKIYSEIDRLEKTEVETESFADYRELAVKSYRTGSLYLPATLLISFALLVSGIALQHTWLRQAA